MKKTSYVDILKESLMEADTTKTSDILGPMVEPILGYNGSGEIQTHKNVSDILQKYYYEGDNADGLVTTVGMETTTKGETDQTKIDGVKKKVEDIINSDEETNQPTDKTLKEMVVDLEEILFEDEEVGSGGEDNSLLESLLEDEGVIDQLEALLEADCDDVDDDPASDDVLIDKDKKTKLEAFFAEADDDVDEDDETTVDAKSNDEDDEDDENPLNIDKEVSESEVFDSVEAVLQESNMESNELIIDNIESILSEQDSSSNNIVGIDNPMIGTEGEDIDTDNPTRKVTVEGLEDSVLEWLIMEIEEKEFDSDNDVEALMEDVDLDIDDPFAIFESDDKSDELENNFKVSKINSDKIRV